MPAGAVTGLTQTQAVMGTPGYMAPEQLRSTKDVDARADIWALGVILYQALSGRLPFPANSITEFAVKSAMDPSGSDRPRAGPARGRAALPREGAGRRGSPTSPRSRRRSRRSAAPPRAAQAMLATTLLAPHIGTADTLMASGPPKVPTTLQAASGVATPAPTASTPGAPRRAGRCRPRRGSRARRCRSW